VTTALAVFIVDYYVAVVTVAVVGVARGIRVDDDPNYPLPPEQRKRYLRPLALFVDLLAFLLAISVLVS